MIAGALAPLIGGISGGIQQMYQGEVASMNAKIAKQNAELASETAGIKAEDSDLQTRAQLGEQEVAQAASGVSLAGKSQVLTRQAARILGRRDALNIVQQGSVERHNALVEAANYKAQANASTIGAISSVVGGVAGAAGAMGTSLINSGSTVASPDRFVRPVDKPVVASVPRVVMPAPQNPLLIPKPGYRGLLGGRV